MNFFYISFFIILFLVLLSNIQSKTEEYYECINPDNTISDPSKCTSIKIPVSDGYKCCAMKIQYGTETSYNCFAIETEYTKDSKTLNDYMSKRNLDFLFTSTGGQMSVDCGNFLSVQKTYKKYSDSFLNCYNGHIQGVENESNCYDIDIPEEENSKCCYLEKLQHDKNGGIISDKRCYIIDNIYFSGDKELSDFVLDESNLNSLNDIKDTNIIIKCKNIETFYLNKIDDDIEVIESTLKLDFNIEMDSDIPPNEEPEKKKSGLSSLKMGLIIGACVIFVIGGVTIFIICYCKKKGANDQSIGSIGPKV